MKKKRRSNSAKHKQRRKRNFNNQNQVSGQEQKKSQSLEENQDALEEPIKDEKIEEPEKVEEVVEKKSQPEERLVEGKKEESKDIKKELVKKKEVLKEEDFKEEPVKVETYKEDKIEELEKVEEVEEVEEVEKKSQSKEKMVEGKKESVKKKEALKKEDIKEEPVKVETNKEEKIEKTQTVEEVAEKKSQSKEKLVEEKKKELVKKKIAKEKSIKKEPVKEESNKAENNKAEKIEETQKVEKKSQPIEKLEKEKKEVKKEPKKKKNKKRTIGIIGSAVAVCVLVLSYVMMALYYEQHFYKDTKINEMNISHMTVDQVEKAWNTKIQSYGLTIKKNDGKTEVMKGEEINLQGVFEDNIKNLLEGQNGFAWPIQLFQANKYDLEISLQFDEKLLKSRFAKLECIQEKNNIEPVNAYISEYGVTGYKIIPEKPGTKIKKDLLYQEIQKAIVALEPVIDLQKINCYEEAEVKAQDPKLLSTLKKLKELTKAKITYEFGDNTEIVDGKKISEWITVTKDGKVQFNKEGVKEFVTYLARKYNTLGSSRWFKNSYGKTVEVRGGNYGWWLNQVQETTELTDLILVGKQLKRDPVYYQTAGQHGGSDIGSTYVEINIAKQRLFFYKEGRLIVESDIVSGNIAKNFGTPSGTFALTYKERNAILRGRDYASPVDYWMPFNGNIGMHDASWRSAFGKDRYLQNGSHGCINLPIATAKKVFEHIEKGIAVIVY